MKSNFTQKISAIILITLLSSTLFAVGLKTGTTSTTVQSVSSEYDEEDNYPLYQAAQELGPDEEDKFTEILNQYRNSDDSSQLLAQLNQTNEEGRNVLQVASHTSDRMHSILKEYPIEQRLNAIKHKSHSK